MGKESKFWLCVQFGFFSDKGSVLQVLSTFKQLGSCSVNTEGSGTFFIDDGVGSCFHGGHLLWINCNCKYQL